VLRVFSYCVAIWGLDDMGLLSSKNEEDASAPTQEQVRQNAPEEEAARLELERKNQEERDIRIFQKVVEHIQTTPNRLELLQLSVQEIDSSKVATDEQEAKKILSLDMVCLKYAEELMRDLLSLDAIQSSDPQFREQRKKQVTAAQEMISSLDNMRTNLSVAIQLIPKKELKESENGDAVISLEAEAQNQNSMTDTPVEEQDQQIEQ